MAIAYRYSQSPVYACLNCAEIHLHALIFVAKRRYVRAIDVRIRAKVAAASGVNPRSIYIHAVGGAYNDVSGRQTSPAEHPTTEQWGRK